MNERKTMPDEYKEPLDYEKLDTINDDLACVTRLLCKAEACVSAPEVMDVVRMAVAYICSRSHDLAYRMRAKHVNDQAKSPAVVNAANSQLRDSE